MPAICQCLTDMDRCWKQSIGCSVMYLPLENSSEVTVPHAFSSSAKSLLEVITITLITGMTACSTATREATEMHTTTAHKQFSSQPYYQVS